MSRWLTDVLTMIFLSGLPYVAVAVGMLVLVRVLS